MVPKKRLPSSSQTVVCAPWRSRTACQREGGIAGEDAIASGQPPDNGRAGLFADEQQNRQPQARGRRGDQIVSDCDDDHRHDDGKINHRGAVTQQVETVPVEHPDGDDDEDSRQRGNGNPGNPWGENQHHSEGEYPSHTPERLVRPPLWTLTSVGPMQPEPAMPPSSAETTLPAPWPRSSRFELCRLNVEESSTTQVLRVSMESRMASVAAGTITRPVRANATPPARARVGNAGKKRHRIAAHRADDQRIVQKLQHARTDTADAKVSRHAGQKTEDGCRHGLRDFRREQHDKYGRRAHRDGRPLPQRGRKPSHRPVFFGRPRKFGAWLKKMRTPTPLKYPATTGYGMYLMTFPPPRSPPRNCRIPASPAVASSKAVMDSGDGADFPASSVAASAERTARRRRARGRNQPGRPAKQRRDKSDDDGADESGLHAARDKLGASME